MKLFDKYVVPRLLNFSCGLKPIRYQRKKVVHLAEGEILEVGIGSGLNLPYYETSRVKKIWGLDHRRNSMIWQKKLLQDWI